MQHPPYFLCDRNSFTGVAVFFCLYEQGLGQMNDDAATGRKITSKVKRIWQQMKNPS